MSRTSRAPRQFLRAVKPRQATTLLQRPQRVSFIAHGELNRSLTLHSHEPCKGRSSRSKNCHWMKTFISRLPYQPIYHSSCSWRTQPLITQSSNMSTMQRTTSSRSKNCHWMKTFILRLPHPTPFYQRTSQNQLGVFSPLYQLLPKSCPRSSSLESKELMLSKADTTMYTFLTSTQVNLIGLFPLSCALQSIQMTSLDHKPPLLSAVCYTVSGTPISTYPLRPSTLGSEFIAMEYVDRDTLSEVWMELPEEEKYDMASQVAEIMRTMRTRTAFSVIGGISPDGSACPLVDGVDVTDGRVSLSWTT
jgi:hypothetical protein